MKNKSKLAVKIFLCIPLSFLLGLFFSAWLMLFSRNIFNILYFVFTGLICVYLVVKIIQHHINAQKSYIEKDELTEDFKNDIDNYNKKQQGEK